MIINPIKYSYTSHNINSQKNNATLSFRANSLPQDTFEIIHSKYQNSADVCSLISENNFEALKIKLPGIIANGLNPKYYTGNFSKEKNTNIFAILCKAHSNITDNLFSNKKLNKANRDLLEQVAHKLVNMNDFDADAKAIKDSDTTLLEYAIECKNDTFAMILFKGSNWEKDVNILKWIILNRKVLPATAIIAKINLKILLDENKMKKEEDEAKIFNTSEIDRYKVIPSKFTPNTLNELGGMIEAKKSAQEFIIKPWLPKYRNKFIENDVQMPNGFMLYGPPGCGKTYLAMAIANEINVPMYRVNLGQIGSSKGHETEANLIKLFSKLEDKYNQTGEPSLLFLDELDSICGNRAKMHTDWKRDEVNTVLQLANNAGEKGIILIGATNFIDGLDPAILRTGRFDKKIEISFPTEEERIEILSKMLKNKPMGKRIIKHIPEIAKLTEGKTCSDLNAIVQSAFRNAIFKENLYLNINDIKEAIKALDFDKNKDLKLIGFNR